jgi:sec-independent protein translocase protein TatB
MFDVGLWELTLLFFIALIVVGPERLPRLARTAGLWIGKARRIVADVRGEIERELQVEEIKRSIGQPQATDEIKKLADRVKAINTDIQTEIKDSASLKPTASLNSDTSRATASSLSTDSENSSAKPPSNPPAK